MSAEERFRPYYDDGTVTIYCGDCRDMLPHLTADVLITDPPYGVGLTVRKRVPRHGGGHVEINPASVRYEDSTDDIANLIREAIPAALAATSRAIIFCGDRMLFDYPRPAVIGSIHIPAGSGFSRWGFQTSQPLLYYGADPFMADGKGGRPNGFIASAGPPGYADRVDHPCPKPLRWMTWAVNRASRVGETILDPFAGSGTTLLAAKLSGRRAIGIEIEEHYCEVAARRMDQQVLDLDYVTPVDTYIPLELGEIA